MMDSPEAEAPRKPRLAIVDYVSLDIYQFCKVLASCGFTQQETKNMTEIRDLQATASELYNSVELKKWILTHTRNETEYYAIRKDMKILAACGMAGRTGRTCTCGGGGVI